MIKSNEQVINETNISLDKLREFNNSLQSKLSVLKKDGKYFVKFSEYAKKNYTVKERLSPPAGYETLKEAKEQIEFYLKSLYLIRDVKVGDKIQVTKYVEPYEKNNFWLAHGIVTRIIKDSRFDVNEFEIEAKFNNNYMTGKEVFGSSQVLKI